MRPNAYFGSTKDERTDMNFSLRQIENEVPEAALLAGETLLERNAVDELNELEKNLWITDAEGFEVEIQLSGNKVIAGTCECALFQKERMCGHFVAGLFLLRQKQQQEKDKRAKEKPPSPPRRLTTGVVLDQIDPDELIRFVREYARTHRNFAIELKARFASSVSNLQSKDKYSQLLDTTINAVRNPNRQITLRGAQRLAKVIRELNQQAAQNLSVGNYVEVADIAQSIVEKVSPVLSKVQRRRDDLRSLLIEAFGYLLELAEQSPAPQLLQRLWKDSLQEYAKLTYQTNQLDHFFFKLMLKVARDKEQLESLLDRIQEQAAKHKDHKTTATDYLLMQIAILERLDQTEDASRLMEQHLNAPAVLDYAIRQAQRLGNRPREKALAQIGLRLELPDSFQGKLEVLLLKIAEEEADTDNIQTFGLRHFFRNLELSDYRKAREATPPEKRQAFFEDTLTQLRERPYTAEIRDTVAGLLMAEEQFEILMAYTEEVQSLDLLTAIDKYLLPRFPDRVRALYRQLLHEYARHYVGPKTARRIAQALEHLQSLNDNNFVFELARELRKDYPERHTLTAELVAFQE